MIKVALVAGPGAGKTTLANALTAHMKSSGKTWYNIAEYARDFINRWEGQKMLEMGVLAPYHIAMKQMRREQNVHEDADGFVTDSPLFLPWFYALDVKDDFLPKYVVCAELYKMFLRALADYTHIVHVVREKEYVEDGTRYQSGDEAVQIDKDVTRFLRKHGANLVEVRGSTTDRVLQIEDLVSGTQYPRQLMPDGWWGMPTDGVEIGPYPTYGELRDGFRDFIEHTGE
jgi:nicotinamide riboside kinase